MSQQEELKLGVCSVCLVEQAWIRQPEDGHFSGCCLHADFISFLLLRPYYSVYSIQLTNYLENRFIHSSVISITIKSTVLCCPPSLYPPLVVHISMYQHVGVARIHQRANGGLCRNRRIALRPEVSTHHARFGIVAYRHRHRHRHRQALSINYIDEYVLAIA